VLPASYPLTAPLKIAAPFVGFVNLFVGTVLRSPRIRQRRGDDAAQLAPQELRTIVLAGGHFIRPRHSARFIGPGDRTLGLRGKD
jgi:Mg2+/Co2+ transporter CorB